MSVSTRARSDTSAGANQTDPTRSNDAALVTGTPFTVSRTVCPAVATTSARVSTPPARSPSASDWSTRSMPPGTGG